MNPWRQGTCPVRFMGMNSIWCDEVAFFCQWFSAMPRQVPLPWGRKPIPVVPSVRFPGAHGQKEPLSLNIATSKEV